MAASIFLHLSADAVRRALPMREAIEVMRDAFAQLARGEVTLPMRARVYDCNAEAAGRFADEMRQRLGIAVERAATSSAAVAGADIICTATTSPTPVLEDRDVQPGTHINAVGAFRPETAEKTFVQMTVFSIMITTVET